MSFFPVIGYVFMCKQHNGFFTFQVLGNISIAHAPTIGFKKNANFL